MVKNINTLSIYQILQSNCSPKNKKLIAEKNKIIGKKNFK